MLESFFEINLKNTKKKKIELKNFYFVQEKFRFYGLEKANFDFKYIICISYFVCLLYINYGSKYLFIYGDFFSFFFVIQSLNYKQNI